ncbi:Fur family transcriptional regulator [Faecalibacter bovis]|uniref:Transcriptional repressor n=1 Tax=Faecalibacter bovis TaxID=2898187 RepID=A0ABX7XF91_9FLAO|nr:transcriptional repressor [Faecalibacter bovis]QTV06576.1 transcriptional repressor [Faecalibacter bovis]
MEADILANQLKERKINPTAMRLLVLDQLIKSDVAMSLVDLETLLDSADRVTIYRTLKKFEEKKLVHTIEDGTGSIKYAICESNCKCNTAFTHAHFHCTQCEQTFCLRNIHLPDIKLPKNFQAEQSSFILKGICDHCSVK